MRLSNFNVLVRLQLVLLLSVACSFGGPPDVQELVRRSVQINERNWELAPQFTFTKQEVMTEGGKETQRTFNALMIEGSPYDQLIEENGKPLSKARVAAEQKKLNAEVEQRRNESQADHRRRVAAFERERQQDHALMQEMIRAFDFKFAGEESVNGRSCFVLEATPHPGYKPPSKDTKVLTGMRGKMWIDSNEYQWVKVEAEVFRPVAFGLFIAHVEPGTEFTLEQTPVEQDIWLPAHFVTTVRANTLLIWSKNYTRDETYSNYRRITPQPAPAQ
jgi:hypothetical protein